MHIFSFPPALRRPHSCPERPRFFLPAVLGLAALCLAAAFQAHAEPRAGAKDAIHLDTARLEAQQQRIYTELRPLFNSLLANDDVWTRCAALYAGAGIIRDNTLADLLRERKNRVKFPETVFINAFIAGATDAAADISAFLDSLPDTFAGCETLYDFEDKISEGLPLRLIDQAYGYYARQGANFSGLAEPRIIWGETFVLSQFLSSEATGHAHSDFRLQAWLVAHPDFSAKFDAEAKQAFAAGPDNAADNTADTVTGNGAGNQTPDLSAKTDPVLSALSVFFDNPDPLTRLTALRMAGRLADTKETLARRLTLAKDPREKLLLYSQLSLPSFIGGGPDFIAGLIREYPRTRDSYAELLEWEYAVYGPELPTLALLAEASDITRDSLAEARPVFRLVLPWAALYLGEKQRGRYNQIASGKFVTGEFYYWESKVRDVLSGDTLLVEINSLGDTAKFRLTGVDCPYPGQPGFEEALARTTELVLGQKVTLRSGGEDALGRRTGWVEYGPEYKLLGQTLIREGLAICPPPASDEHALYYAVEEKAARAARRGLWSSPEAESPAAFRQRRIAETGQDPEAEK